jgi:hypothetical protein
MNARSNDTEKNMMKTMATVPLLLSEIDDISGL